MPRLSIAIVCFEQTQLLEETLVSVLQHRPDDSEILVIHDGRYQDPYELADEVRFLVSDTAGGWVAVANRVMQESRAPVVHFLVAGLQVSDGWTDSALAYFSDPRVASVCPTLVDRDDPEHLMGTGIDLGRWGDRRVVGQHVARDRQRISKLTVSGPNVIAAFYRRADVLALDGFRTDFGGELTDLDLALRLREVRVESVVDPDCEILVGAIDQPRGTPARQAGVHQQRFLKQHAASSSAYWLTTVATMLLETLTIPRSPRNVALLWGRWSELRHRAEADVAREEVVLDEPRVLTLPTVSSREADAAEHRRAA